MRYIVSFDINRDTDAEYRKAHQNITEVLRKMKGVKLNYSVWSIESRFGPRVVFRWLSKYFDSNDSVMVALCPHDLCFVKNPLETSPPEEFELKAQTTVLLLRGEA